jgi:hypothetical protein
MNRCPQSGKQCHPTAASAWRVIQLRASKLTLLQHKQRMPPGGCAYRCDHCHQWHLTRQQHRHGPSDWLRRRLARMEPVLREREARI